MANSLADRTQDESLKRVVALYQKRISPEMEAQYFDQFVAFDLATEEYEIGPDLIEISRRLKTRVPTADVIGLRVGAGGQAVDRFGFARRGAVQ